MRSDAGQLKGGRATSKEEEKRSQRAAGGGEAAQNKAVVLVAQVAADELGGEGGEVHEREHEGGEGQAPSAVESKVEEQVLGESTKAVLKEDVGEGETEESPALVIESDGCGGGRGLWRRRRLSGRRGRLFLRR